MNDIPYSSDASYGIGGVLYFVIVPGHIYSRRKCKFHPESPRSSTLSITLWVSSIMSGQNVPDLAQILRNLAAYQPSQESTAASHESFLTRSPIPSSVPGPSHSSPLPSRGAAQASSLPPGDTSQASNRGWYGHHSSSGRRTDQVLGDPSAITEWGPGLRHVSKLATLNPEFERTVVEVEFRLWKH